MARLAAGGLLAALLGCGAAGDAPPPGPAAAGLPVLAPGTVESVLLITVDTLRADAAGFAGNREAATPVLDRLAAAGWVFDAAHAHNVVTLPSHANILTGLPPYRHGVRDNSGFVLPETVPTAATLLQAAGFATAAFVAAYPLDARYGLARGFDVYDDDYPRGAHPTDFVLPERPGDEVVERALAWWRGRADRRRFLWVHLFEPHAPYLPPAPYAARHPGRPYLGEVEAVDAFLRPLLEPFLAGAEPATLIVLTSDHGEGLGDHGELTHGLFAYDSTLRVPLVLWAPGLGAGRTSFPARHLDLLPTMLAAAGVEGPVDLPGRSLVSGGSGGDPDTYFEALTPLFNQGWAPLRGVLHGGRKLIVLPLPELYDLERDPDESRNLFEEARDEARRLAARLPAESSWPPERGAVSAEAEAALRSLGYLAGPGGRKDSWGPEDDPKNLVELDRRMHRAIDLYQRGRLEEARALCTEVLERRPDMGLAYSFLAQILLQQGRLAEAIERMQKAVALEVASDSLRRQLGLSLAEAGRHVEALAALAPFAESDDPDLLAARGLVLSEAGRQAEARAAFGRLLAVEPNNAAARQHLALVALRLGEWAVARAEAERALDLDPGLAPAWNYLGTALFNLGAPARAVDAWERAVAADPGDFDALYNLAIVAAEIGDAERARAAFRRFADGAPPDRYGPDIAKAREWLRRFGD